MRVSKKGAVPIPYIIALVLGVIVIALIAYWLFFSGGQFGTVITEKACEAKKMGYCSNWKIKGTKPDKDFSAICSEVEKDRTKYSAPECCILEWALDGLSAEECGIE